MNARLCCVLGGGGVLRVQVIRAVRPTCFQRMRPAIGRIAGYCPPGDARG